MNFSAFVQLLALAAAQNSVEWSTAAFYSSLPGDYQCLLPYLPDKDASALEADPSSFLGKLTASPASYYAGLLGLTTGCTWTAAATGDASDAKATDASSAGAPSEAAGSEAPETGVATANRAAAGVVGAGAIGAAFIALL